MLETLIKYLCRRKKLHPRRSAEKCILLLRKRAQLLHNLVPQGMRKRGNTFFINIVSCGNLFMRLCSINIILLFIIIFNSNFNILLIISTKTQKPVVNSNAKITQFIKNNLFPIKIEASIKNVIKQIQCQKCKKDLASKP